MPVPAITFLYSTNGTPAANAVASVTSDPFDPPANSLLFVQHTHSAAGHSTVPNVQITTNIGGITFDRYSTDVGDFAGSNDIQGSLFVAEIDGTPPEDMTVTVDPFTTGDTAYQGMIVYAVEEAVIVQGPVDKIVVSGDTTHTTLELSDPTTLGNLVVVNLGTHNTGGVAPTAPTDFTALHAQSYVYQQTSVFYSGDYEDLDVAFADIGDSIYASWSFLTELEAVSSDRFGEVIGAVNWDGEVTGRSAPSGSVSGAINWDGEVTGVKYHKGAVVGAVSWVGQVTGEIDRVGAVNGAISWIGYVYGVNSVATFGFIAGVITGPGIKKLEIDGPAVRRVAEGPDVSRDADGPGIHLEEMDGPNHSVDVITGPDVSRTVTGPDTSRTVTGPET